MLALGPLVEHPRRSFQPHPPQPRPVLFVVVDQHRDFRAVADVLEALQAARPLGLLVDGRVEDVSVEGEAERDEVRATPAVERGQAADPRLDVDAARERERPPPERTREDERELIRL